MNLAGVGHPSSSIRDLCKVARGKAGGWADSSPRSLSLHHRPPTGPSSHVSRAEACCQGISHMLEAEGAPPPPEMGALWGQRGGRKPGLGPRPSILGMLWSEGKGIIGWKYRIKALEVRGLRVGVLW